MKVTTNAKLFINFLMMIFCVSLINILYMEEFGNWRFIGFIGFALLGWYWDINKWITQKENKNGNV